MRSLSGLINGFVRLGLWLIAVQHAFANEIEPPQEPNYGGLVVGGLIVTLAIVVSIRGIRNARYCDSERDCDEENTESSSDSVEPGD